MIVVELGQVGVNSIVLFILGKQDKYDEIFGCVL